MRFLTHIGCEILEQDTQSVPRDRVWISCRGAGDRPMVGAGEAAPAPGTAAARECADGERADPHAVSTLAIATIAPAAAR